MFSDLIASIDWTSVLIWTLGLAGSALAAAAVWYRKKLREWKEFWQAILQGLSSLSVLQKKVNAMEEYLTPNGGGHLPDAVGRIEESMALMKAELKSMDDAIYMIVATIQAEDDADALTARFDCSETGENTYVSQTYARWLKVGTEDLMGWNYMNYVHPDDRAQVTRLWDICREQHRIYENRHRMVAADGEIIEVSVIATPIPRHPPARRWIGIMRKAGQNGKTHQ